jgi:hypothetical protein
MVYFFCINLVLLINLNLYIMKKLVLLFVLLPLFSFGQVLFEKSKWICYTPKGGEPECVEGDAEVKFEKKGNVLIFYNFFEGNPVVSLKIAEIIPDEEYNMYVFYYENKQLVFMQDKVFNKNKNFVLIIDDIGDAVSYFTY